MGDQSKSELYQTHHVKGDARSEEIPEQKLEIRLYLIQAQISTPERSPRPSIDYTSQCCAYNVKGWLSILQTRALKFTDDFSQAIKRASRLSGRHPFELRKCAGGGVINTADSPDAVEVSRLIEEPFNNVQSLTFHERCVLLTSCLEEMRAKSIAQLLNILTHDNECYKVLRDVHDQVDLHLLSGADILGVTTSVLAKGILGFRHTQAKVAFCENVEEGCSRTSSLLFYLVPSIALRLKTTSNCGR